MWSNYTLFLNTCFLQVTLCHKDLPKSLKFFHVTFYLVMWFRGKSGKLMWKEGSYKNLF